MKLRWLLTILFLFGSVNLGEAQQAKKAPQIGYLSAIDRTTESPRIDAIRLALRELGYIEGQNVATNYRYADGDLPLIAKLADELVRLKVDLIVTTGGDPVIRAAKNATQTISIVMVGAGTDPVEAGFIDSLARPGGNITGMTNLSTELTGKRLGAAQGSRSEGSACRGFLRADSSRKRTSGERGSDRSAGTEVDDPDCGARRTYSFRKSICRTQKAAPRWTLRAWRPDNEHLQNADHKLCVKASVAIDLQPTRICRCWRPYGLWDRLGAQLSAGRLLHRSDSERCQACGSSRGTANEV